MSELKKGNYRLNVIDSTGQFSISGNGYTENSSLSSSSSTDVEDAKNLIDLLQAYILLREPRYEETRP